MCTFLLYPAKKSDIRGQEVMRQSRLLVRHTGIADLLTYAEVVLVRVPHP